jgi:hypothetical protein
MCTTTSGIYTHRSLAASLDQIVKVPLAGLIPAGVVMAPNVLNALRNMAEPGGLQHAEMVREHLTINIVGGILDAAAVPGRPKLDRALEGKQSTDRILVMMSMSMSRLPLHDSPVFPCERPWLARHPPLLVSFPP